MVYFCLHIVYPDHYLTEESTCHFFCFTEITEYYTNQVIETYVSNKASGRETNINTVYNSFLK